MAFSIGSSSVQKGESLRDTVQTIEAMGIDAVVVRHPAAGAPQRVASWVDASVVNAGDGNHTTAAERADQAPFEPTHQFRRNRLGNRRDSEKQEEESENAMVQRRPEFVQVADPRLDIQFSG